MLECVGTFFSKVQIGGWKRIPEFTGQSMERRRSPLYFLSFVAGKTPVRPWRAANASLRSPRRSRARRQSAAEPATFRCFSFCASKESPWKRVSFFAYAKVVSPQTQFGLSLSLSTWISASEKERGIPKQRVPTRVPQRGIQHVLSRLRMKTNRQVGSGAEGSGRRHRAALERAAESPLENSHRRVVFNMCA